MKKIIILLPVYDDWESLEKVLNEISSHIQSIKNFVFSCIIINDSSKIEKPKIKKPNSFNSLKIIHMKKNKGHARCNAFGLRYINQNEDHDYVILMDSDGEDRPVEIKKLIEKIIENPDNSVVAKRIKRSEGPIFQSLYQIHKLISYIFTGKKSNFGNYSCLTKQDIKILSDKASLWSSFSGTVKKYIKDLNEVDSIRGLRYFGPSKMSLYNLLIHSFSIIAVFKYTVFFRSFVMMIILFLLLKILGLKIFAYFQVLLLIFNFLILVVSFRESEKALSESNKNIRDIEVIVH